MKAPDMYKREVDASLEMLKADVAKLKAKAAKLEVERRSRFDNYVDELDKKREEISEQLSDLADAGASAKEDIQRGLKEAWDRLAIAKQAAEARFH